MINLKGNSPHPPTTNMIYLFSCRCGRRYVGKTTQRLETRAKQHVPASLLRPTKEDENDEKDEDEDGTEPKTKTKTKSSTSSNGQHLLEWLECHPKSCELWRIRTGPICHFHFTHHTQLSAEIVYTVVITLFLTMLNRIKRPFFHCVTSYQYSHFRLVRTRLTRNFGLHAQKPLVQNQITLTHILYGFG